MTDFLRLAQDQPPEPLDDDAAIEAARVEWKRAKHAHLVLQLEVATLSHAMFDPKHVVNHSRLRMHRHKARAIVQSAREVEAAFDAAMRALEATAGRAR